jgi:hypothetical protein
MAKANRFMVAPSTASGVHFPCGNQGGKRVQALEPRLLHGLTLGAVDFCRLALSHHLDCISALARLSVSGDTSFGRAILPRKFS